MWLIMWVNAGGRIEDAGGPVHASASSKTPHHPEGMIRNAECCEADSALDRRDVPKHRIPFEVDPRLNAFEKGLPVSL